MKVVHYLNQFFGGLGGEEEAGVGPDVRIAEDQDPVPAPEMVQRVEQVVDLLASVPGLSREEQPDAGMGTAVQQGPDHRHGGVGFAVGHQEQLPIGVFQSQEGGQIPVQTRVQAPAGNDQGQRRRVGSGDRFRGSSEQPQETEAAPQRVEPLQQGEQSQEDEPVRRLHVQSSGGK